jgi:hypothetical protein
MNQTETLKTFLSGRLTAVRGDITKQGVDAIVNAANARCWAEEAWMGQSTRVFTFESNGNSGVRLSCMDDQANQGGNGWSRMPWWLVVILFPMVFRPWWMAIISITLYVLFLRLVFGPFPVKRNSK